MNTQNIAFVELALNILSCSQKDLAHRLKVSPTQISKWKQGDYMSSDMEERFRSLIKIGETDPEVVLQSGSLESAKKWERLILFLAKGAAEESETGYETDPLVDEPELVCQFAFQTLRDMGVELPPSFPRELDGDYEDYSDALLDQIAENPISSLIQAIFNSYTNIYGFYCAYIDELLHEHDLDPEDEIGGNIHACLLDLAACKIDVAKHKLPEQYSAFKHRVRSDYEKWLNALKVKAFRAGVPLRAELLNLIHESDEELRDEAESESFGFNATRLHPDIYMNELLSGMRIIHQVLPAMMKKLGMDENDFKLDQSALYTKTII